MSPIYRFFPNKPITHTKPLVFELSKKPISRKHIGLHPVAKEALQWAADNELPFIKFEHEAKTILIFCSDADAILFKMRWL